MKDLMGKTGFPTKRRRLRYVLHWETDRKPTRNKAL